MKEILGRQLVGMHELRRYLTKLLEGFEREGQEVVITRQGKPMAVIVDLEKYLEEQQALAEFSDREYLASLLSAKDEIATGRGVRAEEVFRKNGL
jgi:prevent-host-death family protein